MNKLKLRQPPKVPIFHNDKDSQYIFSFLLTIFILFLSTALLADTKTDIDDTVIVLPEILVTSSKSEENNIDIPKSIEIFDAKKLQISKVDSLNALSSSISNTNISGIGSRFETTISMRGISNYTTFESSASMYIDDTPIPFSYGFGAINLQDVVKMEVLKGPQGTLYGRSSESGVINLYTPSPSKEFNSEVKGDVGNYKSKSIYGMASGPVNDKFAYMISVYANERDA